MKLNSVYDITKILKVGVELDSHQNGENSTEKWQVKPEKVTFQKPRNEWVDNIHRRRPYWNGRFPVFVLLES